MPDIFYPLAVLALLLGLNGVLAAARSAFVNASRPRLRQMREEGVSGADLAVRVAEDTTPLIATLRLAQAVCRFCVAGLTAFLFEPGLAGIIRQWPGLAAQAESVSILDIGETLVREIMIPRMDVLALDMGTPVPEAVNAVISVGHSRIPVYQG